MSKLAIFLSLVYHTLESVNNLDATVLDELNRLNAPTDAIHEPQAQFMKSRISIYAAGNLLSSICKLIIA